MSSITDVLLHFVCPSLGTVLATMVFAAPITSLKEAISRGSLGDLNPTPWAFMSGNCLGWVAYAVAKQDLFVLFSNAPGFIVSIWLNMGAAKLQYQEMRSRGDSHDLLLREDADREVFEINGGIGDSGLRQNHTSSLPSFTSHEKWVILIFILWMIVLSIVCFIPMSLEKQAGIIGLVVNINLVVFYGAPLSTILEVLKSKSSNSIHRPTMYMTVFNTFFWLSYGAAIKDIMIFFPNASGFILALVQLLLCLIFPKTSEIDIGTNAREQLMNNEEDDGDGEDSEFSSSSGDSDDEDVVQII